MISNTSLKVRSLFLKPIMYPRHRKLSVYYWNCEFLANQRWTSVYTFAVVQPLETADVNLQECISIHLHIHRITKESCVPLCLGTKTLAGTFPDLFTGRRCWQHLGTLKTPTSAKHNGNPLCNQTFLGIWEHEQWKTKNRVLRENK